MVSEFYCKRNFKLYFKGEEISDLIRIQIMKLTKSGINQFLLEYEDSCGNLGIKNPVFTLKFFYESKRKCWNNYQKLKSKEDFQK